MNRTCSTLFALAAVLALVLPASAAAAPTAAPALVFSKATTTGSDTSAVVKGGLYAARGGRLSQITDNPADAEPGFDPDGERIVFVRDGDLFTIRPDGTGERAITAGSEADSRPIFTVDGRSIVFQRAAHPGASRDLYVVPANGGAPHLLVGSPEDEHEATLSPSGKLVAFVRTAPRPEGGSKDTIFSIRLNGAGLARLSKGAEDAFGPRYFPGGIVFDRGESSEGPAGYSDIYAMRANGTGAHKLVGGVSSVYLQDVSADGRTMLFSRYESLCEKPIAGGSPHKIAPIPDGVEVYARFSPDGRRVAVRSEVEGEEGGEQRLFLLDARRSLDLGTLATAAGSAGSNAEIGDGFAWQTQAHAAY